MMMANAGAAAISMRYGFQGPCETTVTACAAGTHAVGNAARLVMDDRCDVMLTGGSEASMTAIALQGFTNMTAASKSGICRPFDRDRDGLLMAEAGAVLVLEELEHARARGAEILGEIMGSASNADAYHITAPAPGGGGAVACMELALADAGIRAEDIRHVNAHGTSTPLNDAAEAEALAKIFGLPGPVVTSTKGVTGHALGRGGRHRGGGGPAGHPARPHPADGRPRATSTRSSPRSTSSSARPGRGSRARRCRTPSASAATTARSSSGPAA